MERGPMRIGGDGWVGGARSRGRGSRRLSRIANGEAKFLAGLQVADDHFGVAFGGRKAISEPFSVGRDTRRLDALPCEHVGNCERTLAIGGANSGDQRKKCDEGQEKTMLHAGCYHSCRTTGLPV
jgi:hypothetical protein